VKACSMSENASRSWQPMPPDADITVFDEGFEEYVIRPLAASIHQRAGVDG